jgi:phosphatidylinositol alpha-1,6-mannosyltransferase
MVTPDPSVGGTNNIKRHVASAGSEGAKPSMKPLPRPTKRLLIVPELFLAQGGIARLSRHHLRSLSQSVEPPLVVVALNDPKIDEASMRECGAAGVKAIGCNRSKTKFFKTVLELAKEGPTVAFVNHVNLAPTLWLVKIFRRQLNYSVGVHGIDVWDPLPWLARRGLAAAEQIISISQFTADRVTELNPSIHEKIRILPCALDPSFPIKGRSASNVPGQILAITRMAAHDHTKGIDHLIQAMESILQRLPNTRLRIVGTGTDRPRLEAMAQASLAENEITFLGAIDDDAMQLEIASCSLFALPSGKEGFGIVFVEAMANGKPCVAANAGGVPEVLNDQSGILVPFGNVPALAEAIETALARDWDEDEILDRARYFSFDQFHQRRQTLLGSIEGTR